MSDCAGVRDSRKGVDGENVAVGGGVSAGVAEIDPVGLGLCGADEGGVGVVEIVSVWLGV
jgi:hypothetical protein